MSTDYSVEAPVVAGRLTLAQIEELVAKPMDTKPDKKFFIALTISGSALLIGAVCLLYTFYYGIGMWGNNQPVSWGFGIVNFVFWVGIGHAGTLISAILFLLTTKMENRYCTFCRSDDNFCCYVCRYISNYSYRSAVVSRIFNTISKSAWTMG
ncbi:MAG: hypothetical protein MZV64_32580 [Ignavibacteriales bacterium]|nr:hypothetical protein [Ignavibacteriales bacterium]